jgi:archaellum component FlaG (FlaF/FlaG flagellin family)
MRKIIITAFVAVLGLATANAQTPAQGATENKNQADITFDKEVHDFGIIPQGVPASYTFYFKNSGKEPLIITNASASCGCTQPEWTKEPIKPGQKGYIKATYNAAAAGPFTKSVTVMSNAKRSTVVLTIKGEVKAPAEASPVQVAPQGDAKPQH